MYSLGTDLRYQRHNLIAATELALEVLIYVDFQITQITVPNKKTRKTNASNL